MGKLINGQWLDDTQLIEFEKQQYQQSDGHFQRGTAAFRNWITKDGSAGPTGAAGFKAQPGRYHLYAAINCPWAHRTLIYRQLKQLEHVVSLSLVKPLRTDHGWVFDTDESRFTDEIYGFNALHQLYSKAAADYTGRVTVPVLWDKHEQTIVSTESAEIIRMFNTAFNDITGDTQNFYPAQLANEIDELNEYIYANLNNGVYQTGFARSQQAYNESVTKVFAALDQLEQRLSSRRYLLGDQLTEADWRLLPTLVRFDVGYFSAFKCNLKALRDYTHLSRYLKDLCCQPGVANTIELDIYRRGYHSVSPLRNPHGIVPVGFDSVFLANKGAAV
ncbi:MAG: putative glutathione S-transferase [Oceanospirillaceae bacterium]|jgi:putative glutathione S-transferase